MTRRTPWLAVALGAAAAVLTSCVSVPTHGPIVKSAVQAQTSQAENPYINPPPPRPGASASEIVSGFFGAMTASPLQTKVAVKYLTRSAAAAWKPQDGGVIAYDSLIPPPHGSVTVRTRMVGADRVGPTGLWLGHVGASASQLSFPMRKENGEWRIAGAPNELLVPRTFYEQAFQDASLYYFDPTARILVPEVVHMPQGQQLITALVQALVQSPRRSLSGVVRSFVPSGLRADPLVVRDGVVAVALNGPDPGPLNARGTRLMLAQFAWTLRQDPSVTAFTLAINDRQVTDAAGASTFKVESPEVDRYDPAVPLSSSQLYALRHGLLVSGQANHLTPVGGPFGTSVQGIGPFAVSLHDDQVAGTTHDSLLVGPVRSGQGPARVLTGGGLLRPSWDFANRLWEIQNQKGGAVVVVVSRGHAHTVHVPGITGADVRRFLVSRDGSRLAAVVHGAVRDQLVISRIRYDGNGRVVSGTRAQTIPWASGTSTRIRDIGWMSPTTIAVLDQVSGAQAEVTLLDVDGSMSPDDVHPIVVQGQAIGLATSPSPATATPPFAILPGQLFDLAQVDTNAQQEIENLHQITYAG